jgi:class 3 adenylate cyclase
VQLPEVLVGTDRDEEAHPLAGDTVLEVVQPATAWLGTLSATRVGLHPGEVEMMGNDIAGIGVHIRARVSSFARPGEVLVSRTVTDLVAGSGIEFEDRGEQLLKGVHGSSSPSQPEGIGQNGHSSSRSHTTCS